MTDDLEALVTQCPHCDTRFRVTEAQLATADGRVRCGACLSVFQGTDYLVIEDAGWEEDAVDALDEILDELSASAEQEIPAGETDQPHEQDRQSLANEDERDASSEHADVDWWRPRGHEQAHEQQDGQQSHPGIGAGDDDEVALDLNESSTPERAAADANATSGNADEMPMQPVRAATRRYWTAVVLAVGAVTLLLQVGWYQKDRWVHDADVRSYLEAACDWLGCSLPVYRNSEEIEARELVVRAHPEISQALMVDALVVNRASFAQPYPVIDLTFTDVNGRSVARRGFNPAEYLAGELTQATIFQPGTPIHISFEIEDPGEDAVNYRMTFR